MNKRVLSIGELRERIDYDPCSGEIRWSRDPRNRFPGRLAGYRMKSGYLQIGLLGAGKTILGHRAIWAWMSGEWATAVIDHINGDPTDNRWSNLRSVPQQVNCVNRPLGPSNTSGQHGVCWNKERHKWQVILTFNKEVLVRKRFDDFQIACLVASEFLAKHHDKIIGARK